MARRPGRHGVYVVELVGEDDAFAAREVASAVPSGADRDGGRAIEVVAPGLALAERLDADRFRGLAFGRAAGELLARTDADVGAAREALSSAPLDREGTVAVRARDIRGTGGVSTQEAERALGGALVDRGFEVDLDDPDHELRALFSDETCLLGWLAVESVRDFGERAPTDRPFFRPGSMDPMLARALVNIAGARPGTTLLDPMCGTGGVPIEAGLVGAEVVGADAQRAMVRGAAENLAAALDGGWALLQADASRLPLADGAVDAAVFDVPYGRQSRIAGGDLAELVRGALAETRRVADRAVVVGDRDWSAAAREAGWDVTDHFQRRVHRSLVRHVHVLA